MVSVTERLSIRDASSAARSVLYSHGNSLGISGMRPCLAFESSQPRCCSRPQQIGLKRLQILQHGLFLGSGKLVDEGVTDCAFSKGPGIEDFSALNG